MKRTKKVIEVINHFPEKLNSIKEIFREENVDYILDTSAYSKPVSLLKYIFPDMLLLNVHLSRNAAVNLLGFNMQESIELKTSMVTCNPRAFYMSFCRTLGAYYSIGKLRDLELMPEIVSKQQLN